MTTKFIAMKKVFTFVVISLFTTLFEIKAQAVQWAMTQNVTSQGMGWGTDGPLITSDGTDLVSFGQITNSITLAGQTLTGNNGKNCYLAKHDESGNELWAKHIQGNIRPADVTTDLQNNIIITGQFWDSLYIGSRLFTNPKIHGKHFVAKFDQSGTFLWARTTNPKSYEMVSAVRTDGTGNIYTAGIYPDTISIGSTTFTPVGMSDVFLTKYDPNGNFQWLKSMGTAGMEYEPKITGGLTNDVYLSFSSGKLMPTNPGGYYVKKFNSTGQEQWSKFINYRFSSYKIYLASDAAENVYLASNIDSTLTFGSHVLNHQPGGINNLFLAKISPAGNWKWARKLQTGQYIYYNFLMKKGKSNDLNFMYTDSSNVPFIDNIHISKLDTAGTIVKTTTFLGKPMFHQTDRIRISDLTSDGNGNTYIAGAMAGQYTFGTISLTAPPAIPGPALPNPSAGFIAKILDKPNTVTGTLFIDQNGNGTKEAGEKGYENGFISFMPGAGYSSTDTLGNYKLYFAPGNATLTVAQPSSHYTFSPQNHNVSFTSTGQIQTKDFALTPIPNRNDVKISVTNITPARPGFELKYLITYENVGTTTLSDSISFKYVANHLTFVSATIAPASQQTGKLYWFYQPLAPTEKRTIEVKFMVSTSTLINTSLNAIASIKPYLTDHITENNSDDFQHIVIASHDPNDKQVNHTEISPAQITNNELLDYVIRFQNTGTDTAFTVVVRDSISHNLQMGSFELLAASHPYTFRLLENGKAEWRFDNILLPDSNRNEPASHGFIRYRMRPKNSLVLGDEIKSRAAIYFDYNAPVYTNYAVTTISLTNSIKEKNTNIQAFRLYPNPAKNYVMVTAEFKKNTSATVSLVNLLGQTLSTVNLPANNQIHYQMPLQELPKGVYLIRLQTETGMQTQRLVIQ